MIGRKNRLTDLSHEIYNAEDLIDGVYNSKDDDYSDLIEINKKYDQLLIDMKILVGLIEKEIR